MTATVVLVHGAWHGSWCWDLVVEQLDEHHVPVVADCEPDTAAAFVSKLVPESAAGFTQSPRAVGWRERPSTYVVCTEDRAIAPTMQRTLADRCDTVVEWPTSHSPFASRPELVTELLATLARSVEP